MKKLSYLLFILLCINTLEAQQSYNITFTHDGKTVFGTFTVPDDTGKFPTIIINPGSGANDRDGTISMVGANILCLYPDLYNETLRPYKELSDALVAAGYAVLRYDKLEYTYTPNTLGTITFHKLWLPVESAIQYVKTRADVDTNKIILIGHSEGSALIPFIAKGRSDVKALISIAGARTPFDSLLAYQLIYIAETCNGDTVNAQFQASQILQYFHLIRTNNWAGLPPLFGVPPEAWYDYVLSTDSVAINYNLDSLCTLFIGLELDINVPPAELIRFQEEITVTDDFWSIPGLIHYMTPNDDPHVSKVLTDTIIYWLNQCSFSTGLEEIDPDEKLIQVFPNPVSDILSLTIRKQNVKQVSLTIRNSLGQIIFRKKEKNIMNPYTTTIYLSKFPNGIYLVEVNMDGKRVVNKIVKE